MTRRGIVQGLVAGALVLGFDPERRSWVTEAEAAPPALRIPSLDGQLLVSPAAVAPYADDFGHMVHRTPLAVLRPGSVKDVVLAVRFCRAHGIQVAARGQGHSTAGQSQVSGGLVIDLSTLNAVEELCTESVLVQAGAVWRSLLEATLPLGLSPPVLTGYVGLSIGGTLSMGGVSGMSYERGAQVHNVLELEVVTGEGRLLTCSPTQRPLLFAAMLGGLGQCGIIVRARLPLVPNPPLARNYILRYADSAPFFDDFTTLLDRAEVHGAYASISPNPAGGWFYDLNVVQFFSPTAEPDDAHLLRDLTPTASTLQVNDMPALAFHMQVDFLLEFLKSIGQYFVPHVWGDVYLPASVTPGFVDDTLATLTPADLGPAGFVLLFPVNNRGGAPAFRLPSEERVFLFDVLTAGHDEPVYLADQLARTRQLYEDARDVGGTLYPIGSTPMSQADWQAHFGAFYPLLALAKAAHDPDHILNPGPGIF